jgi:hypothetical protein
MARIYAPVQLWLPEHYSKAINGDLELATRLMNNSTFDHNGIKAFETLRMQGHVKSYDAWYPNDGEFDEVLEFYAPNDEMALWFIDLTMTARPIELREVITTYREVQI